ncbi:MAG: peptidase P60 [Pseudomonadota bacterium]
MVTRADIVAKAREYLGTPFHHQGRVKGVGVDCAGLVICVARDLGLTDFDTIDYGRHADGARMRALLEAHLERVPFSEARPGDVLYLWFVKEGQHLAFLTELDPPYVLHATAAYRKVVEHRLDETWRARVAGAYRFPGVG